MKEIGSETKQTSWRVNKDVLKELEIKRVQYGMRSIPAFVNYLLARLALGESVKL